MWFDCELKKVQNWDHGNKRTMLLYCTLWKRGGGRQVTFVAYFRSSCSTMIGLYTGFVFLITFYSMKLLIIPEGNIIAAWIRLWCDILLWQIKCCPRSSLAKATSTVNLKPFQSILIASGSWGIPQLLYLIPRRRGPHGHLHAINHVLLRHTRPFAPR